MPPNKYKDGPPTSMNFIVSTTSLDTSAKFLKHDWKVLQEEGSILHQFAISLKESWKIPILYR